MVFSSVVFFFVFLPVVLAGYALLWLPVARGWRPSLWRQISNVWLLAASLLFYWWGEQELLLLMLFVTLVNFLCAIAIDWADFSDNPQVTPARRATTRKLAMAVAFVISLGGLFIAKYLTFSLENINILLESFGAQPVLTSLKISLPLGISFYTFQVFSYTIDVYRKEVKATRNFPDFACYVTFFPQLVAGPIVRYSDIAEELVSRNIDFSLVEKGARRFILGLGKKMLIANTVAIPADAIFALPADDLTPALAWIGIWAYTLQIYFDFSGYSDMAIGLGYMFGFHFLENFKYPYVARNVQDFWRRWHISLSTWFRDYLYIPLGGNRYSAARTHANLFIVFILCGLWHGASWNFLIWGLYHGAFLVMERQGLSSLVGRLWVPLQHAYLLLAVLVGWVFFRADNLPHALQYLGSMAGAGMGGDGLDVAILPSQWTALLCGTVLALPVITLARSLVTHFQDTPSLPGLVVSTALQLGRASVYVAILLASVVLLASSTHNPFIYFRF